MKESSGNSLLYDESELASKRTVDSRYSRIYRLLTGLFGLVCLICAIVLTIVGAVGLRNYGFSNGPLIAGIVLFGIGGAFAITACLGSDSK